MNIDEISLLKISHYRNNEGRTVYWSKPQVLVFFPPRKFRSNRKIKCSLKYDSPSRGHVVLHQPPGFMSGNDSLSCDFVVQIGTRHTHMHVNIIREIPGTFNSCLLVRREGTANYNGIWGSSFVTFT